MQYLIKIAVARRTTASGKNHAAARNLGSERDYWHSLQIDAYSLNRFVFPRWTSLR